MMSPRRARAAVFVVACACGNDEADPAGLPEPKDGQYGPAIVLESDAFANESDIPELYTCDGNGVSPPLAWSNVPAGTMSFAIVMDDPDAPKRVWVHWVAWAIAADETTLLEGIAADDEDLVQGMNDNGTVGYSAPCPAAAHDAHRFELKIFAVDVVPELPTTTTRDDLYRRLDGHALAMGELAGLYDR